MKNSTKKKKFKKRLLKDLLKRKWEEVNKLPSREPASQLKTIA
ncbi:hypothetical protein SAMN05421736_10555 [Evansella caseinilytica]|uniref:Uncharacterized protein n=1 Tax=Evansella caseinilytica TaxID=1503961 RepID=A0A1H3PHU0_9BACI|nr:hypothetical protein [Evansella caseinilytica]SDZ00631.1 hypothetical protein SAMN05421736_10555 [Evansella caseinilytica]